jgi:uncharacterized protein (TIGR03437 family)
MKASVLGLGFLMTLPVAGQTGSLSVVSAASLTPGGAVAPDSIASVFGQRLAGATAAAASLPLPLELAGTTASLTDARGIQHRARLFFVSAGQLNVLIPAEAAPGSATFTVRAADGNLSTGTVEIRPVAPGVFAANGTGRGVAAALALRVAANGARTTSLTARFDANQRVFVPDPIDVGAAGDQVYLSLFGTGLRKFTSAVAVTAGGVALPLLGAVPQPETPGLDQVNVGPLPRELAGRGEVEIVVTGDGIRANGVTASFAASVPDPPAGQWGTRAPLIEPNSEMAVAELNGKIYVIGGYPANRVSVATVQVYDVATDRWSLTTPLPAPINHTMAASANGRLYVIGGQSTANGGFVDTLLEYDPAAATWTRRAPMPTARSAGAAAVINGKIYVAGGRPPRGADFAVYDPAQDRWQTLPDLPTQRNHLVAVAAAGRLYVIGGRFEGGFNSPQSDAVEIFNPETGGWTTGAPMPKPRGGINGVVALGCVHVFGGEGSSTDPAGVYPDHDLYNPVANTWSRIGRMPIPVHGVTGAVFLDGLIYLPGGGTAEGGSSGSLHHQVYRPNVTCR